MSDLEKLKTGICPFTGERYDCGRCEKYESLKWAEASCSIHMGLVFDGMLLDGQRGQKKLHRYVGGKKVCTLEQCVEYYATLHLLGATRVPIGECDLFCYRRGCIGHKGEVAE